MRRRAPLAAPAAPSAPRGGAGEARRRRVAGGTTRTLSVTVTARRSGAGDGRDGRGRPPLLLLGFAVDGGGVEAAVLADVERLHLAIGRVVQDEDLPRGVDAVEDPAGRAARVDVARGVHGQRGDVGLRGW